MTLKQGDRSTAVFRAQDALGIKADGVFGPQTKAAVEAYQRAHGLADDGIIGPATWAALTGAVATDPPAFPPSNYGIRTGAPPSLIVVHHSETRSAADTKRILTGRGLSTHFEVDRDGVVHCYLDPGKFVAWHCGGGVNARSIGIDVTHYGSQEFPAVQVAAVRQLVADLCALFGIAKVAPPDTLYPRDSHNRAQLPAGFGVFRHRNIANTACPAGFPLEECV